MLHPSLPSLPSLDFCYGFTTAAAIMVVVNLAILLAELRGRRAAKREPLVRPALLQEATELDLEVTRSLLREFREVTTQELHVRR